MLWCSTAAAAAAADVTATTEHCECCCCAAATAAATTAGTRSDFDPAKPGDTVFAMAVQSHEFWAEHVDDPALLFYRTSSHEGAWRRILAPHPYRCWTMMATQPLCAGASALVPSIGTTPEMLLRRNHCFTSRTYLFSRTAVSS